MVVTVRVSVAEQHRYNLHNSAWICTIVGVLTSRCFFFLWEDVFEGSILFAKVTGCSLFGRPQFSCLLLLRVSEFACSCGDPPLCDWVHMHIPGMALGLV